MQPIALVPQVRASQGALRLASPISAGLFVLLLSTISLASPPTTIISQDDVNAGAHHTRHFEIFSKHTTLKNNLAVLRAIDKVQSTAMDGGGYFIGVKANPPESPIGYELTLFGKSLISPPRKTSYCSGASCTVFVEAINELLKDKSDQLSPERLEALRMQEPDGARRNDGVKFWGHWNDDGNGTQFALVQYTQMGVEITPTKGQPGDFVNISWKSGVGHSVVFLGYHVDDKGEKFIRYFSSQTGTNGLGDQSSSLEKIDAVKFVRLTSPEKLFTFDTVAKVNRKVSGDKIDW